MGLRSCGFNREGPQSVILHQQQRPFPVPASRQQHNAASSSISDPRLAGFLRPALLSNSMSNMWKNDRVSPRRRLRPADFTRLVTDGRHSTLEDEPQDLPQGS